MERGLKKALDSVPLWFYFFSSGGGVLVIGQEQDSRGGRFSISESFVGRISKLNIWDFALSAETIRELTTTCDDYIGNLIAWPDFLGGINGRVQKLDTDICKGR